MFNLQEDRERVVVRRIKFEELRPEQIQDLEVCFLEHLTNVGWLLVL